MTQTPNELTLAYLAGFFDGEGCVHISNKGIRGNSLNPSYILSVHISNTQELAVKQFLIFGGQCYRRSRIPPERDLWNWACAGPKAKAALEKLLPFLKLKKLEATLGIEFQTSIRAGCIPLTKQALSFRESCRVTMQKLKGRLPTYVRKN